MLISSRDSGVVQNALKQRAEDECCVYVSLCAHIAHTGERGSVLRSLVNKRWGPVEPHRIDTVLGEYAAKCKASYSLWRLRRDGDERVLEHARTVSPKHPTPGLVWHFLELESDIGLHLVPVGQPDEYATLDVAAPVGAPVPPPVNEQAVDALPGAVRGPDGNLPEARPPVEGGGAAAVPAVERAEPAGRPAREPAGPAGELAFEGYVDGVALAGDLSPFPVWFREGISSAVHVLGSLLKARPRYEGFYPPPEGMKWVGGWQTIPVFYREGLGSGYVLKAPHYCSATLDYAATYTTSVLYVPLPAGLDLEVLGNRTLGWQGRSVSYFCVGDVVCVGKTDYKALGCVVDGRDCIKLERINNPKLWGLFDQVESWYPVRSRSMRQLTDCSVRPLKGATLMDPSTLCRVKWAIAERDVPEHLIAPFNRVQTVAAKNSYGVEADDPFVALNVIESVSGAAAPVQYAYRGGAPFEWGDCYSCGKRFPSSRMPGRLCGCCLPVARDVANGDRVAAIGRVVYPGVVQTTTRHPPLKEGKRTVACAANFSGAPIGPALASLPVRSGPGPRLGGVGLDGAIPFVSARGVRPLAEAIQYRVLAAVDSRPDPRVFMRVNALEDVLLGDFLREGAPMELWDWIRSMPSRRRKQLVRALHAFRQRGERSSDFHLIKAFVKTELLPFFATCNGFYSSEFCSYVARLIQAPHDETHLIAGRWLKPLVPRLKAVWHHEHWLFYASVEPEKLDKWLARNAGAMSFFWADYSSFDATYSVEAWQMLERFYARIYPHAPIDFWDVLDAWRAPQGKIKLRKDEAVIKYFGPVMNASGRDDTALANALFNGIALSVSFAAALNGCDPISVTAGQLLALEDLVSIAVVGDDSLVACNFAVDGYKDAVLAALGRFGLVVKAGTSTELVDVTFLAQMPYRVGGQWLWGPVIGRRLYKAFWQADPVGNLPAWVRGVAQQLAMYRHVPVLYDVAAKVDSLLPKGKVTPFKADEHRVWAARTAPTPMYDESTLANLAHRYRDQGLTVAAIRADCALISTITRLPAIVRLHTTDASLVVDDM